MAEAMQIQDERKPLLSVNEFEGFASYSHFRSGDENEPSISLVELELSMTAVAINECEDKFIPFYRKFLVLVGWEPIFEHAESKCKKFLNWMPIVLVLICVIFGYIIQAASCLNRDSGSYEEKIATLSPPITGNSSVISTMKPFKPQPHCKSVILSQYIIPDLLHLAAYIYSVYVMREKETEHLKNLAIRSYSLISHTNRANKLRTRLMRGMRFAAILMGFLVFLSLISSVVTICAIHEDIGFYWGDPPKAGKYVILTLMMISFVAFDLVYIAVVMNYCVQCQLLIYYIKGLKETIEVRKFELTESMKKITELKDHLNILNYKTGIALSMLLFSFGSLLLLGLTKLGRNSVGATALVAISSILFIIYWSTIIAVPVIQALRISAHCNSLQKMGHRVRVKPFSYQNVKEQELDSFLLFTSGLDLKAKLFLIPVQTSCISCLVMSAALVTLLLFQTRILKLWI